MRTSDAVREAVEKAFAEEIGKLVEGINDRIAEVWSGSAPVSKVKGRRNYCNLRCSVVGIIDEYFGLPLCSRRCQCVLDQSRLGGQTSKNSRGLLCVGNCWFFTDAGYLFRFEPAINRQK